MALAPPGCGPVRAVVSRRRPDGEGSGRGVRKDAGEGPAAANEASGGRQKPIEPEGEPVSEERWDTGEPESGGAGESRSRGAEGSGWAGPFSEIQEAVSEMVDTALRGFAPLAGLRFPRHDLIRVPGEGYRVLLDLPGVERADLEVTIVGDELTVSGERRRPALPEGAEVLRSERGHGRFRRSLRLPAGIDPGGVKAKLEGGILRITLPLLRETAAQRVEVETG